jgi:hypothetical protein
METGTNLKAVGFNDEQTTCDQCGRLELRGTVIVADHDGNEVGRYGTTCAGHVLGVKVTRREAVSREAYRRQCVVHEIQQARRAVKDGRMDWARMHVAELDRFHVLHRADELAAMAELRQAVA